MELFLNVMHSISESRFWLMPLLLLCTIGALADTMADVWQAAQKVLAESQGRQEDKNGTVRTFQGHVAQAGEQQRGFPG